METSTRILVCGLICSLCVGISVQAAEKWEAKANPTEKAFIMKAANAGMAEVDLGKIAEEKGGSDEVKDFGKKMVKDHSKANEDLKEVAGKMGVTLPGETDATHKAKAEKLSGLSGAEFDKMYVNEMVAAHTKELTASCRFDHRSEQPAQRAGVNYLWTGIE